MNERTFLIQIDVTNSAELDGAALEKAITGSGITTQQVGRTTWLARTTLTAHELYGRLGQAVKAMRTVAIVPIDRNAVKEGYVPLEWTRFLEASKAA